MTEKGKKVIKKAALYTVATVSIIGIGCLAAKGLLVLFCKVLPHMTTAASCEKPDEYEDMRFI